MLSMISRYLKNQEAVNATLAQQSHNLATLTNLECEKLQKLELVLEPCKYVPLSSTLTHTYTHTSPLSPPFMH